MRSSVALTSWELKEKALRVSRFLAALTAAMKRFSATKEQTVMVGDQIFTDVIAGNLAGVSTILVKPQSNEDLWYTNIIRHVERRILKNVTFTS